MYVTKKMDKENFCNHLSGFFVPLEYTSEGAKKYPLESLDLHGASCGAQSFGLGCEGDGACLSLLADDGGEHAVEGLHLWLVEGLQVGGVAIGSCTVVPLPLDGEVDVVLCVGAEASLSVDDAYGDVGEVFGAVDEGAALLGDEFDGIGLACCVHLGLHAGDTCRVVGYGTQGARLIRDIHPHVAVALLTAQRTLAVAALAVADGEGGVFGALALAHAVDEELYGGVV